MPQRQRLTEIQKYLRDIERRRNRLCQQRERRRTAAVLKSILKCLKDETLHGAEDLLLEALRIQAKDYIAIGPGCPTAIFKKLRALADEIEARTVPPVTDWLAARKPEAMKG